MNIKVCNAATDFSGSLRQHVKRVMIQKVGIFVALFRYFILRTRTNAMPNNLIIYLTISQNPLGKQLLTLMRVMLS